MQSFKRRHLAGFPSLLCLAAVLSGCVTLPQPSANYSGAHRLVFTKVAAGPLLGDTGDAIWGTGFTYMMEDGTPYNAATFRGLYDAGHVYIQAVVEDANFSDTDVVVIAFNPTNTATGYHRLHIFPCVLPNGIGGGCPDTGNTSVNTTPNLHYFAGNGSGSPPAISVAWGGLVTAPTGIEAISRVHNTGNKRWEVQVRISRATYGFVDDNFFGLFVDVVRTDPSVGSDGEAVQYTWPPNLFIGSTNENDVLAELGSTKPPGEWGNATLSPSFGNGVRVDNLGTNHPSDPNKIRLNADNVFHAQVSNYTSNAGTLIAANGVKATFTIANNGLPSLGSWTNVPVSGNPTAEFDLQPTDSRFYQTDTWILSPQQVIDYTNHPAQCVQVTLTSSDPATVFTNPSTMRNMTFVNSSSPFRELAVVNPRGFEPPRGEHSIDYTLREKFVNFDPKLEWTSKIENTTTLSPRLYRAKVKPGAELPLGITVEPPRVALPKQVVKVPAGTGGAGKPEVKVAVRPGEILTLVSAGTVVIAGQSLTAAGGDVSDRRGDLRVRSLGSGRIGAALGSFDDFKESTLVIGSASTIRVPEGANALTLKINDDPNLYSEQAGEGFTFEVVRTPVEPWMLAVSPGLARPVRRDDIFLPLGANLPTWLLRGERDTGRFIRIGKQKFRVFESVGSFGYMVKTIQ